MDASLKVFGGVAALALLGFGLMASVAFEMAGIIPANAAGSCQEALPTMTGTKNASAKEASLAGNATGEDTTCFAGNQFSAQVVNWARKMADALTVDPVCGTRRTAPDCDSYSYYTSAFPPQVIAYGQQWCHLHGGCDVWSNGNYQCVSFVRGAYSQVYPMNLTGDAFDLWSIYQHQAGWQEIPSAAAGADERGLPQPGDVMVFKDRGVGHVAIVISVTAPHNGKNGQVEFANANSTSPYDQMPLLPDLTVDTSAWNLSNTYIVWGYLRPRTNASSALQRISQLDPAQYDSKSEFSTWAYSACSAAAMTEVLNAYGYHLRIQDVLDIERSLTIPGSSPPEPYITPQLGLTAEGGIAATLRTFNLTTTWGDHWTLGQVEQAANSGTPVIVSWPPANYDGGHIVVVVGGNNESVLIADSSSWNRHVVSSTQFLRWWSGFAAVAVPSSVGT